MSNHELHRFVEFIDRFERETTSCLSLRPATREVQIMLHLMRSHLEGRIETPSSLIAASGLSRGTAHRIVQEMIESGWIVPRPRTRTGKTYSLHPSEALIETWLEYAQRMKSMVGTVFGLSETADYFFGASYLSASIIPPLPVMKTKLPLPGSLRILMHADASFLAMQKVKRQFEIHFGVGIDGRALSLDRLRGEILANSERANSRYDIVTCDLCWMAELIDRGAIQPVSELLTEQSVDVLDFHPEALATNKRNGELYGLPVQTTPELLIFRKDILAERGVAPPQTLPDVLDAARKLHDRAKGLSGIAWNGARGTPLGTTFAMLMADFGHPIIALPSVNGTFSSSTLRPENHRPCLDRDEARMAAQFLEEILPFSPPNVLHMSWYERARCYAAGEVAMSYCYTQIMPMFEQDPQSPANGNTGYLPHPSARGHEPIAPLGGWNLCIPANLPAARRPAVIEALKGFTSAAATKLYIENGSMVTSRFSVANDPNVTDMRPIVPIVDKMARDGNLQAWPRPAIPELHEVIEILGCEIHDMLQKRKTAAQALSDAQQRCDVLLRAHGRY